MDLPGKYVIDRGIVLQKAYNLLCIFFANKEIARRSDPKNKSAPLAALEGRFLAGEASRLLIELAIAVRIIDDQIQSLEKSDPLRVQYEKRKAIVDKYSYGLFDNLGLTLRTTCNKIIHSNVMEPHTSEGYEAHELDIAHLHGDGIREIDWEHLNGYVRLSGTDKGKEWYVLLDIEVFISAIYHLLSPE